jgi:hypothetical protein
MQGIPVKPLTWNVFTTVMHFWCRVLGLPATCFARVASWFNFLVWPLFSQVLEVGAAVLKVMARNLMFSLPLMLVGSVVVVVMFLAELSAAHTKLWSWVWLSCVWLADVLHFQSEALLDSTWVLVLMSVAQTLIHQHVLQKLFVSLSLVAPLDPVSAGAEFDERNQLARLMVDPRKCGQCGVGPVDHIGCGNLRSHHGEAVRQPRDAVATGRRGRGAVAGRGGGRAAVSVEAAAPSRISNSCSACGWFAESLSDWPRWPLTLSPAEQLVCLTQAWAELVLKCVNLFFVSSVYIFDRCWVCS